MAIEGIEGRGLKENILGFGKPESLQQAEVLARKRVHSNRSGSSCHVAERIGGTSLRSYTGGVRISKCRRIEQRETQRWIETSTQLLLTEERLARNLVETNSTSKRGNSGGAAERKRLTTLVSLDAADRPSTDYCILHSASRSKFLALANRKLIDVADYKAVRNILVTDRFFTFQVERILSASSAVQSSEKRKRAICVGQGLGPGVRSKQIQPIMETPLQGRLQ